MFLKIFWSSMCAWVLTYVWLFATPCTVAHQAPLPMGFPRQENWSGLPFPPPGDLSNPGIKPESPASPALAGRLFTNEPPGKLVSSVVSDSMQSHGLQHARFPCLSLTPGAYSNSCPLCRWCHPSTSSYVVPFSFCLQSFPASGSFPMSWFFASGGIRRREWQTTSVFFPWEPQEQYEKESYYMFRNVEVENCE